MLRLRTPSLRHSDNVSGGVCRTRPLTVNLAVRRKSRVEGQVLDASAYHWPRKHEDLEGALAFWWWLELSRGWDGRGREHSSKEKSAGTGASRQWGKGRETCERATRVTQEEKS